MGLAWHYRAADPEYGAVQANELRLHLTEMLSNTPVEIAARREGDRDPRPRHQQGPHRARHPRPAMPGALLVAIGDDRTDEDLFAALPPDAVAVHVGTAQQPAPACAWRACARCGPCCAAAAFEHSARPSLVRSHPGASGRTSGRPSGRHRPGSPRLSTAREDDPGRKGRGSPLPGPRSPVRNPEDPTCEARPDPSEPSQRPTTDRAAGITVERTRTPRPRPRAGPDPFRRRCSATTS